MTRDSGPVALVTGAGGFIGSHLVERLLADGAAVVGVDSFTDYYEPAIKRAALERAVDHDNFSLIELDLAASPLDALLEGVDLVFHLAGQPGVRASWGIGFDEYLTRNVLATQRLLEACRDRPIRRFVFSSSSSVYGAAERYPTNEHDLPAPMSPYGVTKLAAEHLCALYGRAYEVPTISLRYFTVYGPRQRPDMAMHRLVQCALDGSKFPLNGSGHQVRDFTFVADAVEANMLASATSADVGTVLNIGGGSSVELSEIISIVERLTERSIAIDRRGVALGDPERTGADNSAAVRVLDWRPRTDINDGLAAQVEWHREIRDAAQRQR